MKWEKQMLALAVCAVLLVVFNGTVGAEIIGGGDATTSEKVTHKGVGDVAFSFTGPDSGAAGLTWDGTYLWLADIWSGNIYKIDPSDGSVISSFAAPTDYPTGLAWDGTNLWVVCEQAATAYKLDPSDGSVISSIHLPGYGEGDPNSACITWDGEYLWHADYTHDTIYKIDPSDGSVIFSFASPGPGPSGLTWDGAYLWHSDYITDTIYKLDPSDGSVVLSFASPASHPWDLAWDGAYLWNADHVANTVYKIDVGYIPGPTVSISTDSFEYYTGDTMTVTIDVVNPTSDPVTFEWYIGVPQLDIWVTYASASIPAGFNNTYTITIPVGDWGPTPFGLVHYVHMLDPVSGDVLVQDVALCAYSPGVGEAMPVDIEEAIMKTIERVELPN